MDIVEQKAKEYSEIIHIRKDLREIAETMYMDGWQSCLDYLSSLSVREAIELICKEKKGD